jgi:TatD DNase family protein
MLVDSHCHLNFPDFSEDREEVIRRAQKAGVGIMQTICTKMHEFESIYAIADTHPNIYCSVGVHPHEAAKTKPVTAEELIEYTKRPKVIGLGETGLDFFYEHSPRMEQEASFRAHIEAARETGIPLIIHTRNAEEDTVRILKDEMKKGGFKGLIHCFASTQYLADFAMEIGFYISISGIITFKKSEDLRAVVKTVPVERLLVETDAPYLAPIPYRGKRNEPAFVKETNRIIAELKQIDEEECARITTENFFRLFNKAKQEALCV